MTNTSTDKLLERIAQLQNPTVAGLDPKLAFIPDFIKKNAFSKHSDLLGAAADALLCFNKGLIDELCDIVPAVKPQAAYYEMYGWQGVRALHDTIEYARQKGMYVITDAKRNDIGATMEAYATAHLGETEINGQGVPAFGADSLTVNGYLGTDGIAPLLQVCKEYNKGIFVLVKTSNPSSGELQDKEINGVPVYEVMGKMCEEWGKESIGKYGYSAVGAVVGATYPKQLAELREKMPHTLFLVPGYGAQGGAAKDVSYAFDKNGMGAIVNSSRAIMCAYQAKGEDGGPLFTPEEYAKAARQEAISMRDSIMAELHACNCTLKA